MRIRITLLSLMSFLMFSVGSYQAVAGNPALEWSAKDLKFNSLSQDIYIEKTSFQAPITMTILTNKSQTAGLQGESFLFLISQESPSLTNISFVLGPTKSTRVKSTSTSSCEVRGSDLNAHDLVCSSRIPEGLVGKWRLELKPTGAQNPEELTYNASWKNLVSNKSYDLGEISSAHIDLEFVYLTEGILTGNARCDQTPQTSYMFSIPSAASKNYMPINGYIEPCDYYKYILPAPGASSSIDWIQISTGIQNTGPSYYTSSIYEILNPDIWKVASDFFERKSLNQLYAAKVELERQNFEAVQESKKKIKGLETQITELQASAKKTRDKLATICRIKPKPRAC